MTPSHRAMQSPSHRAGTQQHTATSPLLSFYPFFLVKKIKEGAAPGGAAPGIKYSAVHE